MVVLSSRGVGVYRPPKLPEPAEVQFSGQLTFLCDQAKYLLSIKKIPKLCEL